MEPEEQPLDPRAAMELMGDAEADVHRRLGVDNGVLFVAWGLAWLVGYGAIWLSTKDQDPYVGPSGASFLVLVLALLLAGLVTFVTVRRAVRGVGGRSATSGMIYGFGWLFGFGLFECIQAAVASRDPEPEVMGILASAGPVLVVSLMYIMGGALWLDWSLFAMGAWLAVVAAVAVFFGPSTLCLLMAVVGGGGFVVAGAALVVRRARRVRAGGAGGAV